MPPTVLSLNRLPTAIGRHLGYSGWLHIDQERVRLFTSATGVDVGGQWSIDARARTSEDRGKDFVSPYFVLSLSNFFLPQILAVTEAASGINYGADLVTFPRSPRVGQRLRAGARLVAVKPIPAGMQTTIRITIEIACEDDPACVIDSLSRWLA